MRKIRISVTDIDAYQYYLNADAANGAYHHLSLDDYIKRLKKTEPPSQAMKRGIDFHTTLEYWGQIHNRKMTYSFNFDDVDVSLPKPDVVEVSATRSFWLGDWDVTLSGRLDAIVGDTGIDYKTCGKPIDFEQYMSAWQWQIYLLIMPRLKRFRYDIFQMDKNYDKLDVRIMDYKTITLSPYPEMKNSVLAFVHKYVLFLENLERLGMIELSEKGVVRGVKPVLVGDGHGGKLPEVIQSSEIKGSFNSNRDAACRADWHD